jgi:hypothetical protein
MLTLDNILHPYILEEGIREEFDEIYMGSISIVGDGGFYEILKDEIKYYYTPNKKLRSKKIKKSVYDNLKIKHYIKIGEECPICLEPIFYKSNAYLTPCGHSFHVECIHKHDYTKFLSDYGSASCPMCRQDIGIYDDSKRIYFNNSNGLDKLEDFWKIIKFKLPTPCKNWDHCIGFNKNCIDCIEYRKTGKYLH